MNRLYNFLILLILLSLNRCHGFTASKQEIVEVVKNSEVSPSDETNNSNSAKNAIYQATSILNRYDQLQMAYMKENPRGMGGGTAALQFLQTVITPQDREEMRSAVITLVNEAHKQRSAKGPDGRIKLGICAENVDEALLGLKTWVPALGLPRGLLHGMDVDGEPIAPEKLGSVYVKYNTGGCMTFSEMRKTGLGFDALWKPGDAVLEMYDGDFRGVYLNVELNDGEFRQFGVLPTDLFLEEEEW
mmetsp:Transcript_13099/g.24622  ORF Transcript_13099/g.24622 Transcript_13099/m.24622 type:complete len:245 (-) Transcript_13099:76-810(-)